MRAKLIENIEFERGEEPRKAMGIGSALENYDNLWEKMSEFMKEDKTDQWFKMIDEITEIRDNITEIREELAKKIFEQQAKRKEVSRFIKDNSNKKLEWLMPLDGTIEEFVEHIILNWL